MTMFGSANTSFGAFGSSTQSANHNPMKDIEVTSPPDDSVSSIAFSPGTLPSTFLVAGSWDNNVSYYNNTVVRIFSTFIRPV